MQKILLDYWAVAYTELFLIAFFKIYYNSHLEFI